MLMVADQRGRARGVKNHQKRAVVIRGGGTSGAGGAIAPPIFASLV